MTGATYDTGALIAAERGDDVVWALHRRLLERRRRPTLSAAVLGQAWRGGPQATLSRFVKGCHIEPVTEAQARSAGSALAASGASDVIDAVVVVTACARGDVIVTSDPDDLRAIASATGRSVSLVTV